MVCTGGETAFQPICDFDFVQTGLLRNLCPDGNFYGISVQIGLYGICVQMGLLWNLCPDGTLYVKYVQMGLLDCICVQMGLILEWRS